MMMLSSNVGASTGKNGVEYGSKDTSLWCASVGEELHLGYVTQEIQYLCAQ